MKRVRYTPLVNMKMRSVLAGLKDITAQLAEIYQCPPEQIDVELWKFIEFSFLLECENGELGFPQLDAHDTEAMVAEKFALYLDADMEVVRQAQTVIAPPKSDPVTGPLPPEDAQKN